MFLEARVKDDWKVGDLFLFMGHRKSWLNGGTCRVYGARQAGDIYPFQVVIFPPQAGQRDPNMVWYASSSCMLPVMPVKPEATCFLRRA